MVLYHKAGRMVTLLNADFTNRFIYCGLPPPIPPKYCAIERDAVYIKAFIYYCMFSNISYLVLCTRNATRSNFTSNSDENGNCFGSYHIQYLFHCGLIVMHTDGLR